MIYLGEGEWSCWPYRSVSTGPKASIRGSYSPSLPLQSFVVRLVMLYSPSPSLPREDDPPAQIALTEPLDMAPVIVKATRYRRCDISVRVMVVIGKHSIAGGEEGGNGEVVRGAGVIKRGKESKEVSSRCRPLRIVKVISNVACCGTI